MSFIPNLPPSILAKNEAAGVLAEKRTKEDYRKMKELEEARKLATVPAMKDEEGKDINPHIPQYIMQAPWYYGSLQPTLRHQKMKDVKKSADGLDILLDKGVIRGSRAVKFRKGACANCGAMTHKAKDCFERPRKTGAKYTGDDIAPDEYIQSNDQLGFDAKRDRWNGYDPAMHKKVLERYETLEEARKIVKRKQLTEGSSEGVVEDIDGQDNPEEDEEEEYDEDKYGDDMTVPGQKFDSKERQSIRNLRLREDTAKYLFNLNVDSAYYDSKTRSMRENPFTGTGKDPSEVPFAGDNFVRYQGDSINMMKQQMFAWEMHTNKGLDVHLQADPTRLEMLTKELSQKQDTIQSSLSKDIVEKYGGTEHFRHPEDDVGSLSQSENYVEYSRTGTVLKGAEKPTKLSRYEEDIYPLNHTSVWGSYWEDGRWGFKCCHLLIKNSYCTGERGRSLTVVGSKRPPDDSVNDNHSSVDTKKKKEDTSSDSSSSSGSSDDSSDSD